MSYSNSFPQQRPTLNLDFANSGKLDSRISYTRSSTGTYLSNERHLSSENLVLYSNLSSGFTFGRTTLASTNNSAPDGGSDAASILETADTATHEVYETFSCVSGQQYSFVFYLKANGRTKVIFKPQATSTIANVEFDLTAVTSTVNSGSVISHSVTAIGSTGWYKCAVTVTSTATGTGYTQFNLVDGSGNESYTGEVSKGIYAWGASVSSTGQTVLNETSGSIHREYAPLLKTASADEPRFEFDASGNSEGLLIEAQATNSLTYSEDFSNAAYTKFFANVESNVAMSPTGELTADKLTESTDPGEHRIGQNFSTTSGSSYTVSVIAKAAGRNFIRLGAGNLGVLPARVSFDLSNGTIGTVSYGTGKIESLGNGFYRCSVTATATSTATTSFEINVMQLTNTPSYTGDGYSGVLLFGAMAEQSSNMSSYTKTTSSSVTRAADSCSVDLSDINFIGGDFSLIFDTPAGTGRGNYPFLFEIGLSGSTSERLQLFKNSSSASATDSWYAQSSSGIGYVTGSEGSSAVAISYANNDLAIDTDTGTLFTDTTQLVPLVNQLAMGSNDTFSGNQLNGHIKRVALYNVALSDTELAALTS